jgi:predicted DsbA family dithiol-disulfide isomerase
MFPADRIDGMLAYFKRFASDFGIEDMKLADHVPNTRRALAVTEYAREQGRLTAFEEAAMSGYWRVGLGLEEPVDLGRMAESAGLDAGAAIKAMDDEVYLGRVDALREEAGRAGVTAIPAFFFGDDLPPLVGCQPYKELKKAAEKALSTQGSSSPK